MRYSDNQLAQINANELEKFKNFLLETAKDKVVVPGKGLLKTCRNSRITRLPILYNEKRMEEIRKRNNETKRRYRVNHPEKVKQWNANQRRKKYYQKKEVLNNTI